MKSQWAPEAVMCFHRKKPKHLPAAKPSEAVCEFKVTRLPEKTVAFDLNKDKQIDVDSWMSKEMKRIVDACKDDSYDHNMFIVSHPSGRSRPSMGFATLVHPVRHGSYGFMMFNQRHGFVHADSNPVPEQAFAHELGHGGFGLTHTENDGKNVMYNYGGDKGSWRLRHAQWDLIHGAAGSMAGSAKQTARKKFIILIGGPGIYDGKDPEHDKAWYNYIDPVFGAAKSKKLALPDEDVQWLIYAPAYEARWTEDVKTPSWFENNVKDSDLSVTRYSHTRKIIQFGASDYVDYIKRKANEYAASTGVTITVIPIRNAQEFWDHISSQQDGSVSRVWYLGQGNINQDIHKILFFGINLI